MTAEAPQLAAAPTLSPDGITQLAFAFTGAKCLLSAVETGLFSELARCGPQDARTLAAALDLHPRAAPDFFDALVGLGLLERSGGRYANTPHAAHFLDRAKDTYIGDGLEMVDSRLYGFWDRLTEALRSGEPQNEAAATGAGAKGAGAKGAGAKGAGTQGAAAKGAGTPYPSLYADPARRRRFQRAMSQLSRPSQQALAERFPWSEYVSVADLGCGDGALLHRLLTRWPHLTGVGFDLPESADSFAEQVGGSGVGGSGVGGSGLDGRARFEAGDFFTGDLPAAEVFVLGHVLQDWDLEARRLLLARAYDALPVGGAIVVFEAFIDDDRRANLPGLLLSLNALIETPAGWVSTLAQCRDLLAEAGFRDIRDAPLAAAESMVRGVK